MLSAASLPQNQRGEPRGPKLPISVSLLPPDFLPKGGGTLDIAPFQHGVLALRSESGRAQLKGWNVSGAPLDIPDKLTDLVTKELTMSTLASAMRKYGPNSLSLDPAAPNQMNDAQLAKILDISEAEAGRALKAARKLLNERGYSSTVGSDEVSNFSTVLTRTLLVGADIRPSRIEPSNIIIATTEKTYLVFTADANHKPLEPKDWEVEELSAKKLAADPSKLRDPRYLEAAPSELGERITKSYFLKQAAGVVSIVSPVSGELLFADKSSAATVDPTNERQVVYVNPESNILNTIRIVDSAQGSTTEPGDSRTLPLKGSIEKIAIDPHGNFLTAVVAQGGDRQAIVLTLDTLATIATIENAGSLLEMDSKGNIVLVDSEGRCRFVSTNFSTIAPGGAGKMVQKVLVDLAALGKIITNLDISALTKTPAADANDMSPAIREQLGVMRAQLAEKINPVLVKAPTRDDLKSLLEGINQFSLEHGQLGTLAVADADRDIRTKLSESARRELEEKLGALEIQLGKKRADPLLSGTTVAEMRQLRRETIITDLKLREGLDDRLRAVESAVTDLQTNSSTKLQESLGKLESQVLKSISLSGNVAELDSALDSSEAADYDRSLIALSNPDLAVQSRRAINAAVREKRSALERQISKNETSEATRIALAVLDATSLAEEATRLSVSGKLTASEFAPLQKKFSEISERLPPIVKIRLTGQFAAAQKNARVMTELDRSVPREQDRIVFGKHAFPKFMPEPPHLVPVFQKVPSTPELVELVFAGPGEKLFRTGKVIKETSVEAERSALTAEQLPLATAHFSTVEREVPKLDPRWTINPHVTSNLEKICRWNERQINGNSGLTLLIGEGGAGKNVLLEIFAHFTNYEFTNFSCNSQQEKEDITYLFKFDKEKGTICVDSNFIEAIQKPGTIILLDEINTLPPGVLKMLNPLFDYRRTLFLPDGRRIKAHPSVIFAGAMNPGYYLGVKKLSPDVVSRLRAIDIGYPPEKVDGKYAWYEAEMGARNIPGLSELSQDEFILAWNAVVNKEKNNGSETFVTAEMTADIEKLHHVIRVANRMREAYRAFRSGENPDEIEFIFSLREMNDISSDIRAAGDIVDLILEVVIPKVDDPAEKARVEAIIRSV